MSDLAMRERFATTACELLDQDRSVAVVLADISASMFAEAAARHPAALSTWGSGSSCWSTSAPVWR